MAKLVQQSTSSDPLFFFLVLSSDHISPATGKSPTVTISKNGAAFAAPAGAVTEIANGWYQVAGNATDTNTLGDILLRRVPVALGACWSEECSRDAAHKIGRALGWDQPRVYMELLRFEEEREQFLHPRHSQPTDAQPGCGTHAPVSEREIG